MSRWCTVVQELIARCSSSCCALTYMSWDITCVLGYSSVVSALYITHSSSEPPPYTLRCSASHRPLSEAELMDYCSVPGTFASPHWLGSCSFGRRPPQQYSTGNRYSIKNVISYLPRHFFWFHEENMVEFPAVMGNEWSLSLRSRQLLISQLLMVTVSKNMPEEDVPARNEC